MQQCLLRSAQRGFSLQKFSSKHQRFENTSAIFQSLSVSGQIYPMNHIQICRPTHPHIQTSLVGKANTYNQIKIKSSLYSPHYAEACNELRGPSPRLSAWATQLRRNVATVASRWRHCADLTGPGIEPQTSRTESVRFATELTAGYTLILSKN